jgi:hypothetical protein
VLSHDDQGKFERWKWVLRLAAHPNMQTRDE